MIEYKVTIDSEGTVTWKDADGHVHREGGPAVEWKDGSKEWYKHGKRHREDGPACEYANGTKHWYVDDEHHRKDGPAIEWANGLKQWCLNGKLHREDGPAVVYLDGHCSYWLEGQFISKELFERLSVKTNEQKDMVNICDVAVFYSGNLIGGEIIGTIQNKDSYDNLKVVINKVKYKLVQI